MRLRSLLAILAFAFTVLAVVWWSFTETAARTVRLPDGREIEIKAFSFGTQHRYVSAKPIVKMLAPVLGPKWAAQHGLFILRQKSSTPTLMIWVQWRGISPTNGPAGEALISDEQGHESEPITWSEIAYMPGNQALGGLKFVNFPRRHKKAELRFYQRDKDFVLRPLAQLKFRNPAPREYPAWTAARVPFTRREAAFDFTLTRITTKGFQTQNRPPNETESGPSTTLHFRVSKNGQSSDEWNIKSVEASDPTGNVCAPTTQSFVQANGMQVFKMKAFLWPDEPAWKLNVEFARRTNFSSADRWSVNSVPLSGANGPTQKEAQKAFHGVTLTALQLKRVPQSIPTSLRGMRRNAELTLKMIPPTKGVNVTLERASDEQGEPVRFEEGYKTPDGMRAFGLEVSTNAQALDFVFAVHQSLFLEFLAKPELEPGSGSH